MDSKDKRSALNLSVCVLLSVQHTSSSVLENRRGAKPKFIQKNYAHVRVSDCRSPRAYLIKCRAIDRNGAATWLSSVRLLKGPQVKQMVSRLLVTLSKSYET